MTMEKDISEIKDLLRDMPGKIGQAIINSPGSSPLGPSVNSPTKYNYAGQAPPGSSAVSQLLAKTFGPMIDRALGINPPPPRPAPTPPAPSMNLGKLATASQPATPVMNMNLLGPQPPGPSMNMSILSQPQTPQTAASAFGGSQQGNQASGSGSGDFTDAIRDFADAIDEFKQLVQEMKREKKDEGSGFSRSTSPSQQTPMPRPAPTGFPSARTGVQVPTMGQVRRS